VLEEEGQVRTTEAAGAEALATLATITHTREETHVPFANNQGIRTHYVVEGSGPPVLLIHGFSGDHTSWSGYGFVTQLRERFQLLMPDVRAHGQSDGPADPAAYRTDLLAADMVAILDDRGIAQAHVLGYSMGGVIGYTLARDVLPRVRSLVVGGISPYDTEPRGEPAFLHQLYERAAREGAEVLVEGIRSWAGAITPANAARLRAANVVGGAALLRWRHDHLDDFTEALAHMHVPGLLYCGEDDAAYAGMQRAASELPNTRFIGLPGMNHVQASKASAQLVPEVIAFWDSVAV
jgi:pimeloyl-ACP methyl ester carboxylesterase